MSKLSNFFDEIITSTEQGYATEPQVGATAPSKPANKEDQDGIVDVVPVQTYVEESPVRLSDELANDLELKKEVKRQSEAIKRKEVARGKLRTELDNIISNATQETNTSKDIKKLQKLQSNVQSELSTIRGKIERYNERLRDSNMPSNIRDRFNALLDKSREIETALETQNQEITQKLAAYNTITTAQAEEETKQQIVKESVQQQLIEKTNLTKSEVDKIDSVAVVNEIQEAVEELPDADNVDFDDISIVVSDTKKTKAGYYKTKVSIKTNNIPNIINNIATYIKQQSQGIISPRVCDLRVIGNTNKTQLRSAKYKLTSRTVVFKPNPSRLKVNKGTRFMISVPENFSDSNPTLIVYLQESRAKTIMEINGSDFASEKHFTEWLGDMIANYYYHGYDTTIKKLQFRQTENPLFNLVSNVLRKSSEYRAKLVTEKDRDEEGNIFDSNIIGVDFQTTTGDNQWLIVSLRETQPGIYELFGSNKLDPTAKYSNIVGPDRPLKYYEQNMISILDKLFARDWTAELRATWGEESFESDLAFQKNYVKLKHRKLREAYLLLHHIVTQDWSEKDQPIDNEANLVINGTLSKNEFKHAIKQSDDYDAEAILGKTDYVQFALIYFAKEMVGGDNRHGSKYITTDQYYDKYSVRTRADYALRSKVSKDLEGNERNYNARKYVFQLKYRDLKTGKEGEVFAKTFKEIMDLTEFLKTSPIFRKM